MLGDFGPSGSDIRVSRFVLWWFPSGEAVVKAIKNSSRYACALKQYRHDRLNCPFQAPLKCWSKDSKRVLRRPWIVPSIQAAVLAGLGVSVLGAHSVQKGMRVVQDELPDLPSIDIMLFGEETVWLSDRNWPETEPRSGQRLSRES
jgi:hypothetical protein